ncbi:MAG: hypothetical protein KF870_09575 [Leadbetterella sp.]|nr:hypothetical protein [Leadbetterella sp.]
MKTHTTNYYNTFIEVAEDCPLDFGEVPVPKKDKKTVAEMQYELIAAHPYRLTSDEVVFRIFAEKNELLPAEYEEARINFFSKGQPCLRASPLGKRYGFGIHYNPEGRMALYGAETEAYKRFMADPFIKKLKAMRTSKK